MCRSTDHRRTHLAGADRLKIKSFFVRFPNLKSVTPPPESLTLFYLPRIDETELEIDGFKIRPDSPAFVTLHRIVSPELRKAVVFGCRDRVRASEGTRFEVYFEEERFVEGIFRRSEDGEWRMECKCAVESVEICVDVEGAVAMFEKVEVRRRKRRGFLCGLEEIPEGREVDGDGDCDGCVCCGLDGESPVEDGGGDGDGEIEVEGVGWAVDLGIWAVCLGVGYLVSKAAHSKTLRRKGMF